MSGHEGRVVVVTGGASGIGQATAQAFVEAGATVVVADRDHERVPLVEAELQEYGVCHGFVVDVTDQAAVAAMVAEVLDRWGRIDALDNNAAALELTAEDPDLLNLDPEVLVATLRGNVVGPVVMTKAVLPAMIRQGGGAIVNIASVSGMLAEAVLSAYGMSKAAVIHLTKATAVQYGRYGVRCNAVAPAVVATPNNLAYAPAGLNDLYRRNAVLDQVSDPSDIADAVLFLASEAARRITGQVLPVDCGTVGVHPIVPDEWQWVRDTGGFGRIGP